MELRVFFLFQGKDKCLRFYLYHWDHLSQCTCMLSFSILLPIRLCWLQSSKGEPMDVDLSTILASDSQGDVVPQASPRKTDRVPQSPLRPQSGASAPAVASSQGSNESPLVSLLSQPSSKDSKQIRRASNPEQEMPPTKVPLFA